MFKNSCLKMLAMKGYFRLPKKISIAIAFTLVSCGSNSLNTGNLSADYITNAGELTITAERDSAIAASQPPKITSNIPVGDNVTATCTTEGWGESEVRQLTDTLGLDLSGSNLYPGALLQGKAFELGNFVPITIPRAPGTIYMTGLVLENDANYFIRDVDMSASGVNQAISQLITDNKIQGTTAKIGYAQSQAHSYENMLFELGIDGRYASNTMASDLKIDSKSARNYSFVKFTQTYYDMIFDDSTLAVATDVFRDGEKFADPEGQIAPGNPPLYVSKVSYGRMVFFVAESTHDALEVEVALRAAVQGGAGDLKVDSGLTYQQVLERSKIYYYVIGGSAELALKPIEETSQEGMFNAVKGFIADRNAANFSAASPGEPIAYTLKYLKNRTPAAMSYSVNYDKKNCEFARKKPPAPKKPRYYLEVENLDSGEVTVLINGDRCGQKTKKSRQYDIYRCLKKNQSNDLKVKFNTSLGCNKTSIVWYIHANRNYTPIWPTKSNGDLVSSAQIKNKVKCDDFYWTTTINTATSSFSNYDFID